MRVNTVKCLSTILFTSIIVMSCNDAPKPGAVFQCPMKCEGVDKTYDKQGDCPVCEMELKELKQ